MLPAKRCHLLPNCPPLLFHIVPTSFPFCPFPSHLLRHQVLPYGEHLGCHVGGESIHLLAVLLDLLGVQHTLKSARLLGHLEQSLPLILGQRRLFGHSTLSILSLPLRLPLRNLGLLTGDLALKELEVIEVGVVGLDALKEQVTRLLEERINGEVEAVDRGIQGRLDGVSLEV